MAKCDAFAKSGRWLMTSSIPEATKAVLYHSSGLKYKLMACICVSERSRSEACVSVDKKLFVMWHSRRCLHDVVIPTWLLIVCDRCIEVCLIENTRKDPLVLRGITRERVL